MYRIAKIFTNKLMSYIYIWGVGGSQKWMLIEYVNEGSFLKAISELIFSYLNYNDYKPWREAHKNLSFINICYTNNS